MRRLLAVSAVVLAPLLLASPARAVTYCVPAHAGCVGTTAATIQAAFDAAKVSAADDIVKIGPGTNFAPGEYNPVNGGTTDFGELQVIGSGVASTTIVGNEQQDALRVLFDGIRSPTIVKDLRVVAGQNATGVVSYGKIQNVVVNAKFATDRVYGISLYGNNAEATGVTIDLAELSENSNHQGVTIGGSDEITTGARISNVSIVADHGMDIGYPVTVSNVAIDTRRNGIHARCVPLATLHDVEVLAPPNGTPLWLSNSGCSGTANTLVDARHLTLVGGGINGAYGAIRFNGSTGINQLNLRSSIVADADQLAISNDAAAYIKVSNSLLEATGADGVSVTDEGGNVTGVDPLFRDVAAGDLSLRWPSPAIDLGDPAGLGAGEPATDRAGNPRIADGNGDGVARRDAGAYEYHGPAAKVTATPATANIGQVVAFDASASTSHADPKTFAWSFGDGGTAGNDPTVEHAFATAGTHIVSLTVTDAQGRAATQTISVVVVDPNAPTPTPTPGPSATPTPAPTATPTPVAADFSFATGKRLTFRRSRAGAPIVVNGPGRAAGALRTKIGRRTVTVAKGSVVAGASGRVSLTLRMSKKNARALKRSLGRRTRKASLKVTFTRSDGGKKTRSKSVSIRLR